MARGQTDRDGDNIEVAENGRGGSCLDVQYVVSISYAGSLSRICLSAVREGGWMHDAITLAERGSAEGAALQW